MYILHIEPSPVILSQTKYCLKIPTYIEDKRDGVKNPQKYNLSHL